MRNLTAPFIKVILGACLLLSPTYAFNISHNAGDSVSRNDDDGESSRRTRFRNRSGNVVACEEFIDTSWNDMITNMGDPATYVGNPFISGKLKTIFPQKIKEECLSSEFTAPAGQEHGLNADQLNCIKGAITHLSFCESYMVSFDNDNYTSEDFEERETAPSMGANGLGCLNQPDQASQQQCLMQAQQQPPLKCVNRGPETHDFLACKRILNFIDGFAIGKQVMQMQQGFRATSHQMDLQQDYLQKVNQGEAQVTDAMAVQRDSLEKQGNLAYEMAAFDAAKAGALLSMIASAPRPGKFISETCTPKLDPTAFNAAVAALLPDITAGIVGATAAPALATDLRPESFNIASDEQTCESAIGTLTGENYIFMRENQEVFDRVKGEAMKAGLEALANGMKGKLLHDQAAMVDDAMKDIDEFAPPEFPVAEALEATASECLVDPNAEGCVAPNGAGFEGFRDSGLNINMGGGAANLGSTDRATLDDDETSVNGSNGPKRDLIPNEFGVVQQEGDFSNEFSDGTARAGSIKAGELAAGGGGGGGGAGGGGGGLGGGPARGPASKKQPSGKKDINIKTKGDGLATVGGRGRIGAAKKTKAANPFSKLLGKSKTAGNKTLNFRGPAQLGSKKGSLFQMISNRYNVVQSKDRLLKYEAQKGN